MRSPMPLREYFRTRGLKVSEVIRRTHTCRTLIYAACRGKALSPNNAKALADYFRITIAEVDAMVKASGRRT